MSMILANDVHKSFGALEVLSGVSLKVERGETVALLGRSGSGKSTFLRCLNGLEQIQSGTITVGGHQMDYAPIPLRNLRKDVGIVFQSYNLFPHLRVGDNIALAPRLVNGASTKQGRAIAESMLERVGLIDKIDELPNRLSGGQQQRVAIARALAMQPKVMLFDEVTSALDPELTGEVLAVMESLARDGMTMVTVTHEMAFARRVAKNVVFMHRGQVREYGPASIMDNPQTAEFRAFLSNGIK